MKRRNFLQASTLFGLPLVINGVPVRAIARNSFLQFISPSNDKVLVLIQLNGGNDGLNTVLPLDQYSALDAARSKIIIPERLGIKIDDKTALHPALRGFKTLYDDAKMKIVQSVGYPNQNRSHFRSTDIWTSGSAADQVETTGWLGRYFYNDYPDYPYGYPNSDVPDPLAITIGSQVSETCQGKVANYSLAVVDPTALRTLPETPAGNHTTSSNYTYELAYLKNTFLQTNSYSEVIKRANEKAGGNPTPSGNLLLDQLLTVTRLIRGGLRTKVYIVGLNGFDTHANQCDPDNHELGVHASLLSILGDAVAGFQAELEKHNLQKRVMAMTFSEFGRRIKANDSTGTDHGSAAPLFLFGSCVNPGILGDNPTISPRVANDEGVAMQYDFRSVYASVLVDWFEVDSALVKQILFRDFQRLPIVDGCSINTRIDEGQPHDFNLLASPNPARDFTRLSFTTKSERVRLSLFNSLGSELRTVFSGRLQEGSHQLTVNTADLPAGNYFFRIVSDYNQKTVLFAKE